MIPVSLVVLLGMSVYIVPKEIRRQRNETWIYFFFKYSGRWTLWNLKTSAKLFL